MERVIEQSETRPESSSNLDAGGNRRPAHGPYRYALRRSFPVALPLALITGTVLFWTPMLVQDTEITWTDLERQSVVRLFLPTVLFLCLVQGFFMFRRSVAARRKGELHPPLLFGQHEPSFRRGVIATTILACCWVIVVVSITIILSELFPHATLNALIIWLGKMVLSLFVVLSVVLVAARIAIHDAEDSNQTPPLA